MKYKVLTSFSYGFDDGWQLDDRPHRFNSIQEAETEIEDHIKTYKEEMNETVERVDYKIVEADTDEEGYDYIVGCSI